MFRFNNIPIIQLSAIFLICICSSTTYGQLRIAKIYNNNMVIQRDQFVKVWGWADGGDKVNVNFLDQDYESLSNKDGEWNITLPHMKYGGPYTMTITSNTDEIVFDNILIGDVWLCSGQSNMEWVVANSNDADNEIAQADDAGIRHFKVPLTYSDKPQDELSGGAWTECNPEHVGAFTAVGYFFAKNIRTHHNVPIGLLNSSWGGSRIEPWMRAEILSENGENPATAMIEIAKAKNALRIKELEKITGPLTEYDKGTQDGIAVWANASTKDEGWKEMSLPTMWEDDQLKDFDGMVWFRKSIVLSQDDIDKGLSVSLAKIDDSDITYINGVEIGRTIQQYNVLREYNVPSEHLVVGENILAVRVEDTGGGGGIYGEAEEMFAKIGGNKITLAGNWRYKPSAINSSTGISPNQIPTMLYNKMINPIINFPIKGALWYQGESNASPKDAYEYRNLFSKMIIDWRKLWGIGEFPFLWVQLANFMAPDALPAESSWAVLRESQTATLALENTAQAVIIDLGEADDIHPRNKQDVGYRLSLAARKLAFGENMMHDGPTYTRHIFKKNKVLLSFSNVGSSLVAKDKYGYLKGFSICGPDGKYVWAQAKLLGNQVEVWSSEINKPTGLRYAWGNNPDDANLYNQEGLPAVPFRIDQL